MLVFKKIYTYKFLIFCEGKMKKYLKAILLYLTVTLIVMYSWFHYGLIYGGGDVGLPTYAPQRVLEIISKPWWSEIAPGFPRPLSLAGLPAQVFFVLLQYIGLPAFGIQAVVYGILLFLMGLSMYFLTKDVIGDEKEATPILAGFYYMINPFMMVMVWHRFAHGVFFLAASLPLLFLFWRKWLKERKIINLLKFILINLIFSYMFTTTAYVITLWILLASYTLFEIFVPWKDKRHASIIMAYSGMGFSMWLLTNVWWILPVFFVFPTLASAQHSVNEVLSTLSAISNQSIIPYSLAGLNPFYLFYQHELGDFFMNKLFMFIPWIGVIFIFVGLFSVIRKKRISFFSILFILAVFLAKGMAGPLGYFYPFLFERFFFLGLLRNPFEKIGPLIPLAGSILFAIGFLNLANYFWKRNFLLGKAFIILSFGLFFGIYHWPFWTGTLLGTLEKRNFVDAPKYYQQADEWIKSQKREGNILHLPLATTDSAAYRWQYSYSGPDPDVLFFTSNPSLSMRFGLPYLDNALSGFDFINRYYQTEDKEYLKELLRVFNIRFIVLHNDINWQSSGVQTPEKIGRSLDMMPFLKKQKEIGELIIYEIDEDSFLDKIYLTTGLNKITEDQNNANPSFGFSRGGLLPPIATLETSSSKQVSEENSRNELPQMRLLPDSPFYILRLLKEAIQKIAYEKPDENIYLELAGKKLVEINKTQDKNPNKSMSSQVKQYMLYLDKAVDKIFKDGLISDDRVTSDTLKIIFGNHRVVLGQIYQRSKNENQVLVNKASKTLNEKMVQMNILPVNDLKNEKELDTYNRKIFRFSVAVDGDYEILMSDSQVAPLYLNNLNKISLQIDNDIFSKSAQVKNDLISYGIIHLKAGKHEISFTKQNSINLVKNPQDEMELTSGQHVVNPYEIKIEQFNPGSNYLLSFDYWIKKGNNPIVKVIQDSDPDNYLATGELNKQRSNQFIEPIRVDAYNKYWSSYQLYISPRQNTSNLSFQIVSRPWDDCESFLVKRWLCDQQGVRANFQKPSTIVIKNIKVQRILDNKLFLKYLGNKDLVGVNQSPTNVIYAKKDPLVYEGSFIIEQPSYLIFSETFDKGWELILSKDGKSYTSTNHVLANMYGNGWFLEKSGSYDFRIRFAPRQYFYFGLNISIISLLSITVFYLTNEFLKSRHEKSN